MPSLQDATLRHALLYLRQLVAENDGYLAGGESMLDALAQFDRDWENISTAQDRLSKQADAVLPKQIQMDPSLERLVDFCNAYPDAGAYVLSLRLPPKSRLTWLTAALKASRLLQNDLTTQAHLGNLGLTYMELGQTQTAIEYFQQALQWL
jgi:tetratricopeptide (TPR) repeat protein